MADRERPTRQELSLRVQNRNLKSLLEDSPPFRKFLFTLFNEASIFYPTYSRGSTHDAAYQEGRRALGLEVLHMLKYVRPDILSLIEREGNLLERDIEAATLKPPEDDYAPTQPPDDDERDEPSDVEPG